MTEFMLRPDAKGRVSLGELAKGVSSYKVTQGDNGQVTLTPYTEIPYAEKWIFEHPEVLEEFKKHLEQKQAA